MTSKVGVGPRIQTTGGVVRGYTANGVTAVKGVPYAATTAGDGRFRPPRPVTGWTGERSSLFYGPITPQQQSWSGMIGTSADEDNFLLYRGANGCVQSEDCLRLNVWTPAAAVPPAPTRAAAARQSGSGLRPVMVWLHGGGFMGGAGNDLLAYDGENLALNHDVVVVSSNHRLNILGYLDLSSLGVAGYEDSVNVGMQDIVAMLEWVRDNAVAFGGDPDNVTIFGQSGGGVKVAALQSMPSARGLFHRAIIQSGSMPETLSRDESEAQTRAILSELDVDPAHLDRLADVSIGRLIDVARGEWMWRPTLDGTVLSEPLLGSPGALTGTLASDIPLLVGTNFNEVTNAVDNPLAEGYDEDDLAREVRALASGIDPELAAAYRAEYPDAPSFSIRCAILDAHWRSDALRQARARASSGTPVWNYLFSWRAPVLDDRPGVFHSAEIAYVFDNAGLCANLTGGDPVSARIATEMSTAWAAFARTGDPGHSGIPEWRPWTGPERPTMVFDRTTRVRDDLDGRAQKILAGTPRA